MALKWNSQELLGLADGFIPMGLPFPWASDRLQGKGRSETATWLVLVGGWKKTWQIFIIARWLIDLGSLSLTGGGRVSYLLPRLVPNSQAQVSILPQPPVHVSLCSSRGLSKNKGSARALK